MSRARRVTVAATVGAVAAALGLAVAPAVADPVDTVIVPAITATSTAMHPLLDTGSIEIVQDYSLGAAQLYRSVNGGSLAAFASGVLPGASWQSSGTKLYSVDDSTSHITRLDPATGVTSAVPPRDGGFYDLVNDNGYVLGQYDNALGVSYYEYVENNVAYRHDMNADTQPCALDATALILCEDKVLAGGSRVLTLSSVPPKGGAVTPLGTVPMVGSKPDLALTPSFVVLLSWNYGTTATVARFPRAGGAVSTVTVPTPEYPVWAANDTATLVNSPLPHLVTGTTVTSVTMPAGVSLGGIVAGASRFLAWGSGVGVSGLYPVSTIGVVGTRLASPSVKVAPDLLRLNAGRLWGVDYRQQADRLTPAWETVWSRALTSPVGSESVFPQKTSLWYYFDFVTAGRAYLQSGLADGAPDKFDVTFFDGTTKTYSASGGPGIGVASGPYVGLSSSASGTSTFTVRRADGALLATLPTGSTTLALFGSRLVYATGTTLYLRDLATAASTTNPKKIGTWSPDYGSASLWGDRFAFSTGTAIKVIDVRTGAVTGSLTAQPDVLKVDDGVIAYSVADTIKAWSGVTGAAPVTVSTAADPNSWDVEDGQIAWVNTADLQARVGSLPSVLNAGKSKPRLLGVMGTPSVFTPNVTGQATVWKPQIDLSKNLSSWSLTIKNSAGTVVRTLSGGATTNASIRTASWDAKNASGVLQPNGTYTWTMTGAASDGSGVPVGVDGTSVIGGSIKVATQAPGAAMTNAALASTVSATTTAPVTWKAVNAAPGTTTTFETQVRSVSVSSTGVRTYGAWTAFGTGTATSKSYTASAWSVRQFRVRAKDNFGRVGAWSGTSSMVWPVDDRSLTKSGTWTDSLAASDWLGTYRRSGSSGAALSRGATWTSRISVVGVKSANSGRVKVYVDGVYKATVDLYSSTTKLRQTLWAGSVTYGKHTVKVVAYPYSSTRPYTYIDGIGFTR